VNFQSPAVISTALSTVGAKIVAAVTASDKPMR
jgi:hypothetical protein